MASVVLFVRLLSVAAASIAVAVLRRHLLIWSDFAPRWIFEFWFFVVGTGVVHVGLFIAPGVLAHVEQG